jgi:hypothetical protein
MPRALDPNVLRRVLCHRMFCPKWSAPSVLPQVVCPECMAPSALPRALCLRVLCPECSAPSALHESSTRVLWPRVVSLLLQLILLLFHIARSPGLLGLQDCSVSRTARSPGLQGSPVQNSCPQLFKTVQYGPKLSKNVQNFSERFKNVQN